MYAVHLSMLVFQRLAQNFFFESNDIKIWQYLLNTKAFAQEYKRC